MNEIDFHLFKMMTRLAILVIDLAPRISFSQISPFSADITQQSFQNIIKTFLYPGNWNTTVIQLNTKIIQLESKINTVRIQKDTVRIQKEYS